MKDVLVFSGTTEGRSIAKMLDEAGADVHVRVATGFGAEVMDGDGIDDIQVGSCGGAEGIAREIRNKGCSVVVDATHPYASVISEHIRQACEATGTQLVRILRDASAQDGMVVVGSVKEAAEFLSGTEGVVLVTTGSKEAEEYTRIPDYKERVVIRVLSTLASMEKCASLGFEGKNLVCAQGPFSEESNVALINQIGAKWIVTKDSGPSGGFPEKVSAAEKSGARIVLVARPPDNGLSYADAVHKLEEVLELDIKDICRRRVSLIGIGMGEDGMTVRSSKIVDRADLVIGAERMLHTAGVSGKDTLVEYRAAEIAEYLDKNPNYNDVAILLSGDIGFYSGAKKLLEALKGYDVNVECGISTVAYLCSKMGVPWQDVRLTSAHGREFNVTGSVRTNRRTFALLTGSTGARALCQELDEYLPDVTVTIGQNLGYPDEKIVSGSPKELLDVEFGELCAAVVENPSPDTACPVWIPDEDFTRGDAPMTKSDVRSLSVAKLRLSPDSVAYDVGAGTGSVSIAMALCCPEGKVYAIEKEDVAADLIEVNKRKLCTPNVEVIRGLAPEAMRDLPAPTHAFIGGSSGNLKEIVDCLIEKNPRVRIVINSVTIETLSETMEVIRGAGLVEEETVCVNVSKARRAGRYHLMTAQNPVYISVVRK
ncbi:MAG: precorrin-6A reductase [Candidatus Methanomethylophilaceae archaeon]|nr:precorrin-6A reductase [Candidatus Methanomethylophilaceae archaeon]